MFLRLPSFLDLRPKKDIDLKDIKLNVPLIDPEIEEIRKSRKTDDVCLLWDEFVSKVCDALERDLIDDNIREHTIDIAGESIWVSNYPYCFGVRYYRYENSCASRISDIYPKPETALRLKAALDSKRDMLIKKEHDARMRRLDMEIFDGKLKQAPDNTEGQES